MFRLLYLLDPQIAPTAENIYILRVARPFTPRNEPVVTHHEPWYRYMSESGN